MGIEIRKGKRRSRLEIIYDILTNVERNYSKTRVMSKANLSYKQIKKYLNLLVNYELIEMKKLTENKVVYQLTEKGKDFLESYAIISDFTKELAIIKK